LYHMSKKLDAIQVIGLGQACVDYLGTLNAFPHEDEKAEITDLHIQCGGPASTALVTLSRLGVSTAFLGSISDDPFGVKILNNLKNEKIVVSSLKITSGYTSQFAFIAITKETGKRTIFWHRGTVPPLLKRDVDIRQFPKARILHTDGLMVEASIEAARQAQSLGMTVVMDAGTMRDGSKELSKFVNILIASETFASPLVGQDATHDIALHALRELGPDQVVITLGASGSIGLDSQGVIVRQKAFPVSAVDTTGAGDVYHGGYLFGLLQGLDMCECMRFASATAALKCTRVGAQNGIPNLKNINRLLKR
jgi:sulfofructose kinase